MEKFFAQCILLCGKIFIALAVALYAIPIGLVFGFWWLVFAIGDHVAKLWDWAEENG